MQKLVLPALALALALGTPAFADDAPNAGLKEGAFVGAFNVKDCTGPEKGTSLCYRCKYGARPVVSVFARTVDENLVSLVKNIDKQVGENSDKKMAAFVVLLTDDPDAAEEKLVALAKKHDIKNVPLTVFDGPAGPPKYKISKDADVTVLMWNKSLVKVNQGLEKGKLDKKAVESISKETSKILN